MAVNLENPDRKLLEACRGSTRTIADLAGILGITASAVRQRLDRMTACGLICREEQRTGRGRPLYRYSLTAEGQRALGNSLPELAVALWKEIQDLDDPALRERIMTGVAARLVARWGGKASGATLAARMQQVARALRGQKMPVQLEHPPQGELPIIRFCGCPYPDLSEMNHAICELETTILSAMLGQSVTLTSCRCDSANGTCTYELQPAAG